MKLLVLGGTQFVGVHLVNEALARGHEVTLFNRGKSGRDLFPEVERLIGDREGNLGILKGRKWDAVVDVNGYAPATVRASAELLADAVERYVYISTIMVYSDYGRAGQDESAALAAWPEATGVYAYGLQKAQCEQVLQEIIPGRALMIRPTFIAGPRDNTDRLASWVRRVRQGGEMLAPGKASDPLQLIDARDLAAFTLRVVEERQATAYNVAGSLTWGDFLGRCKKLLRADTTFTWVSDTFLEAQGFADWSLPLWTPPRDHGLMTCDYQRALAAGLALRPLEETIQDTLRWHDASGTATAGLASDREATLLRAWRESRK